MQPEVFAHNHNQTNPLLSGGAIFISAFVAQSLSLFGAYLTFTRGEFKFKEMCMLNDVNVGVRVVFWVNRPIKSTK